MADLIDRQAAIDATCMEWCGVKHQDCEHPFDIEKDDYYWCDGCETALRTLPDLPSAQPTLRERALMLLLNWAVECDFGYDNFPEEYERYKNEIEDMSYFDGMIYIAEKEVE